MIDYYCLHHAFIPTITISPRPIYTVQYPTPIPLTTLQPVGLFAASDSFKLPGKYRKFLIRSRTPAGDFGNEGAFMDLGLFIVDVAI